MTNIKEKSVKKEPKAGMKIYIPTSLFISHGEDDVAGGIATINKIDLSKNLESDHYNYCMIGVKEVPGRRYNWNYLMENQSKWKKDYGKKIAHPDPDYGGNYD